MIAALTSHARRGTFEVLSMSTNALITLHGLTDSGKNSFKTVTFYRHCDGYCDQYTADMFYQMFANPIEAKGGELECFLANNAKDVELSSFEKYLPSDCSSEYHYHLDCQSFQLIVNHCEWYGENVQTQVFKGCVTEYINQYLNADVCVLSIASHCFGYSGGTAKEVFTIDSIIKTMSKSFKDLERMHKQGSSNPNNTNAVRTINRLHCFLGDMNLSKEQAEYRDSSLELVTSYEGLMFSVDNQKAIQAAKDKLNTTHVMLGDQPVALTILD